MRHSIFRSLLVASLLAVSAFPSNGWTQGSPPLQAEGFVDMPDDNEGQAAIKGLRLDGGGARFTLRASNRPDGRTVQVALNFRYPIPPDTIALDEIIDRIVVETSSDGFEDFGRVELDPNDVHLNPNSSKLNYRLTLYRPESAYKIRVRVFGNYE
jgi:hypothetical protein